MINNLLLSLILLSTYLFADIKLTSQEKNFLTNHQNIKVANEMDWPPFDYNEFNKPKGLSIDFIKLISQKAGFKIEFINNHTWTELVEMFKNKKIDIIPVMYKNKTREKFTLFSTPYYKGKLAIFSTKKSDIKSISNLSKKTVGIQTSHGAIPIVKEQIPDINLVEIPNTNKMIQMLATQQLDAIIGNPLLFYFYAKENQIINIELKDYITMKKDQQLDTSMHIGIRNDWDILHSIIQKAIDAITEEEFRSLESKWMEIKINNTPQVSLTLEEKTYIQKKDTLNICVDPQWMPFEEINKEGLYTGMGSDLYSFFKKQLALDAKISVTTSWNETLNNLQNRECDLSLMAKKTKKREEYLDFTTSYLSVPYVVVTKNDKLFVDNFEDILDKKFTVIKGYSIVDDMEERYPNVELVIVENIKEGLEKVINGEVYGYLDATAVIGYAMQTHGLVGLSISCKLPLSFDLSVATRDDEPILGDIFQKAVSSLNEIEKKRIYDKWIAVKQEKVIDYTIIWQIVIVAIFIIAIIVYWNRRLNREIIKRKELHQKFQYAVDNALCGYWEWNLNTNKLKVSEGWKRHLGYENENISNEPSTILDLIHQDDKELVEQRISDYLSENINTYDVTFRMKHQDNSYKWIKAVGVLNKENNIFYGFHADINETKLLERKELNQQKVILEQSKMVAMGEMIGNIAHQWRQPLSVISMSANNIMVDIELGNIDDDNAAMDSCESIQRNAIYLSKTIEDFTNFIKGNQEKVIFELENAINSFLLLVDGAIKSNDINIVLNLQKDLKLNSYDNQLTQCLINIFNNSKDILKYNNIQNRYIFITTLREKDKVIIRIKDNGGGIPEDIIYKVFDPYFTTKHKSQGTGLGLHMTYNLIVDGMDGIVEVRNVSYEYESKSYIGAEFIITLPLS